MEKNSVTQYRANPTRIPEGTNFSGKIATLPISVGQEYHEGEKFRSVVQLVQRREFAQCIVIVCDLVQRHNLRVLHELSLGEATDKARALGDAWLTRNKQYLDESSVPYTIIRWDECVTNEGFVRRLEEINQLRENDQEYRTALAQDTEIFVSRKARDELDELTRVHVAESCVQYLIEETAVIGSFFVDNKFEFLFYPGGIPRSVEIFINRFIKPEHPELINHFGIHFKKRNGTE